MRRRAPVQPYDRTDVLPSVGYPTRASPAPAQHIIKTLYAPRDSGHFATSALGTTAEANRSRRRVADHESKRSTNDANPATGSGGSVFTVPSCASAEGSSTAGVRLCTAALHVARPKEGRRGSCANERDSGSSTHRDGRRAGTGPGSASHGIAGSPGLRPPPSRNTRSPQPPARADAVNVTGHYSLVRIET